MPPNAPNLGFPLSGMQLDPALIMALLQRQQVGVPGAQTPGPIQDRTPSQPFAQAAAAQGGGGGGMESAGLMEILQNPMMMELLMGGSGGGGRPPAQAPGIHMPNLQGLMQPYLPQPVTPVSFGGMFG